MRCRSEEHEGGRSDLVLLLDPGEQEDPVSRSAGQVAATDFALAAVEFCDSQWNRSIAIG